MFSIVSCPRCAGQVSIAAEASPSAQLRCPLCDSQYPLSELLATMPPALVILDSPLAAGAAPASDEFAPLPADDLAGFAPQAAWEAPVAEAVEHEIAEHEIAEHEIAEHEIAEHEIAAHEIAAHEIAAHEIAAHEIADHEVPHSAGADELGFAPLEDHEFAAPAAEPAFAAPEEHGFAAAEEHGFAPVEEAGELEFPAAEEPGFAAAEEHGFAAEEAGFAPEEAGFAPVEDDMFAPHAEAESVEQAEFNIDEPLELSPHEEPPHAGSFAPFEETIVQDQSRFTDTPHALGEPQEAEMEGFGFEESGPEHDLPAAEGEELSFEETGFAEVAEEQNGEGEMAFPTADEDSPFAEHEATAEFGQEEGEEQLEFGAEPAAFGEEGEADVQHFGAEEEGEFGGIEQHRFAAAEGGLQPGDYTRVPPPDTGDEFAIAEEGDEFSLPAPGAPAEAPVATKGKKAAKPAKAPKPAKARSEKPRRSLAGALVAMLAVMIGGITLVAGSYYALIFFMPERDFLNVASKLPSWARPAKKTILASNPGGGMPPAAPMNQQPPLDGNAPPAGNPAALPDQGNPAGGQPGAPAEGAMPAENAGGPKPAKPAGELEELPGEKPTDPSADLNLLGIPKPKAKPADMPAEEDPLAPPKPPVDDGFGTPPAPKMQKPAEPAEEPSGEKPAPAPAAKVPGDEALPAERPAKPAMKDDLGLDEPAKKPEPAPPAEPEQPAAPAVKPLDAPAYSIADVDQAMTDVLASVETMDNADTLTPDELKKARAQYFRRFYRLGEVMTFAADDALAPALPEKVTETTTLLRKTGSDAARFGLIGRAAIKWLAYPNRGEHAGILVAGTVASSEPMGKLFATHIAVPGVDTPVTVYSGAKPKAAEGDRVILLGSVVDDPKGSLPGYDGPEAPVVWNGLTVKLPAEAAE